MASDLREGDQAVGELNIGGLPSSPPRRPPGDNVPSDQPVAEPATPFRHGLPSIVPLPTAGSEWSAGNAPAKDDLERISQRQNAARLMRRLERHSTCLNDVRLLRSQVKSAWERFYRYRVQYVDSRRLYEHHIDPFTIRYSGASNIQGIELLRRHFDSDRDRLERQCAEAIDLEKQLEAKEEELEKREVAFAAAANDMALHHSPSPGNEAALHSSPQSVPPATPRLDPRLERYFDKAGDVKVMCERLLDLDQWRQETVATRELLSDRGEVMPLSNEDFEQDYLRKRAVIEEEVNLVIAEADQLREVCEQAGLNVTAYLQAHPDPGDDAVASSDIDEDVVPLEIGPVLMTPAALSYPERETGDIIDAILDGPTIRRSPTENDIEANPRVDHWVENLLFPAAADIGNSSKAQREAKDVPEDLDPAGPTAVPSLASFSQKPKGQQILTAVTDAQGSKSDTTVTVLGRKRASSAPNPPNILEKPAELTFKP